MHDHQQAHPLQRPGPRPTRKRQPDAIQAVCALVVGRSMVATAAVEGERQLVRYTNPAFTELAGGRHGRGQGRPLGEAFPGLAGPETRALLAGVFRTGAAASIALSQRFEHSRRGPVPLAVSAWPCGLAPAMTLVQFLETPPPITEGTTQEEFARDLRDVNERLLVAGVREHELAEESARRLALAEAVAGRTESALRTSHGQTQSLARRLITAQEAERTRLARELHDDVNQQLAGLSIALSALRGELPEDLDVARLAVDRIQQRTSALIDTIRGLSHELHPGSLRSAGLIPALQHLCAEIETQDGDIVFRAHGDIHALPDDIALTLYRVAQEALRNVARHARARHTQVVLSREHNRVQLRIGDDGCGFDHAERGRGLGLLSMEERVLAVNGEIEIASMPGLGTHVCVSIPEASFVSGCRITSLSTPSMIHAYAALE